MTTLVESGARRTTRLPRRLPTYAVLVVAGLVAVIPFVWMILSSFKTGAEVRLIPPTFLPREWTLENYSTILGDERLPLGLFYRNSAIIALANVATTLLTSSLLGFLLAKVDFRGRRALFGWVLVSLMIPFQVTMIPGYLILAKLNLLNQLWGLIIPSFVNAFGIFLMRQFALSIPNEILDAARLDGASEWTVYWRIALPHLGPALATLGMLTFMFNWNAYLWPLIVLTEEAKRTLPIILFWYSTQHSNQLNLVMAASVIVVLPVLVVFVWTQKWIVRGLTLTGNR